MDLIVNYTKKDLANNIPTNKFIVNIRLEGY
jgi:hypothetical protein